MQSQSLPAVGVELLSTARGTTAGRSSRTVYGGHEHSLRQTVIALCSGTALAEHASPAEATLHVLAGRVRLSTSSGEDWEGGPGDLLVIPPDRHDLTALDDAAVLLTVATGASS